MDLVAVIEQRCFGCISRVRIIDYQDPPTIGVSWRFTTPHYRPGRSASRQGTPMVGGSWYMIQNEQSRSSNILPNRPSMPRFRSVGMNAKTKAGSAGADVCCCSLEAHFQPMQRLIEAYCIYIYILWSFQIERQAVCEGAAVTFRIGFEEHVGLTLQRKRLLPLAAPGARCLPPHLQGNGVTFCRARLQHQQECPKVSKAECLQEGHTV